MISDIKMPRMDGLTLCHKIKEDPEFKALPVALFSSIISHSLKHKGASGGADTQFAKPDLQLLSEKVLQLIDRKSDGLTPPGSCPGTAPAVAATGFGCGTARTALIAVSRRRGGCPTLPIQVVWTSHRLRRASAGSRLLAPRVPSAAPST